MNSRDVDVLIIGAGASGLYAAALLQDSGYDVVVIEARHRVGGRLLSPTVDTGRVDLGATWYWANEPRIGSLITSAGLPTFPQHTVGDMMFQPDSANTQRLDGNQLGTPAGRLASGMQSLPEVLNAQLASDSVVLDTEVTSVRVANNLVTVGSTAGTWTAQNVVVATPPSLAMSRITFEPAIDDLVAGLARATPVWMGSTVKAVAVFDHAFWREDGLAGSAYSYSGPMREIHDMSGPDGSPAAIFGFCGLPVGADTPTEDEIVAQLVALFGERAATPIEVFVMDWRREAFTSPPNVEQLTNYQTYGHPDFQKPFLGGRVHWASTETSTIAPGHIEGAFAVAERSVNAILANLHADNSTPGAP